MSRPFRPRREPLRNANGWKQLPLLALLFGFTCGVSAPVLVAQRSQRDGETIVMIRHGEKPASGLGQLTCRGLNRSLALAPLLLARYGKPDAIYAPDPAVEVKEGIFGPRYSYVRALATIEPTAIRAGMPVNTQIGFDQVEQLQQALLQPAYAHSLIFVAWEHDHLRLFAKQLLQSYGDGASLLPPWPSEDFGTIYVFHVTRPKNGDKPHVTLSIQQENLGGKLSNSCPQ